MKFDIPRNRILPITTADLVVDPAPHPYEVEHRAAIEVNWALEKAENPALFNGEVMFFSSIRWADGRLDARCHVVRYATFMHWRRTRRDTSAEHLYAHAMPVSSDGALIAIRMAGHTANAGRVYFAAGSLEPEDIRGDRMDIASNMAREVREETGLDLDAARTEKAFHGWSSNSGTVLVRRYFLDLPAEEIVARIRAHIEAETNPEIDEAIVIRDAGDLPDGLMAHMPPLIDWHFRNG
ncbi:MAG: NUDIX hydrolase [Mesorhizobium sp.]|nr:NUDIX hydrolase [Mesorhizobium sp.]MCO5163256.1 NUDIX hydrolase [Mesorhizobium sp.]